MSDSIFFLKYQSAISQKIPAQASKGGKLEEKIKKLLTICRIRHILKEYKR